MLQDRYKGTLFDEKTINDSISNPNFSQICKNQLIIIFKNTIVKTYIMPPKKKIRDEAANFQLITQQLQPISDDKKRESQCSVFDLENQINQTCENLKAMGKRLKTDLCQLQAQSLAQSANMISFKNQWKQKRMFFEIEQAEQSVEIYQDLKRKINSVAQEIKKKKKQIWKLSSCLNCTFRINDCSICLQAINPYITQVSKYNCGHCIHQKCYRRIQKKETCPNCNTKQDMQTNYFLIIRKPI